MLLKLAGSVFVVGASSGLGFGAAKDLENKVRELERLEAALVALSSCISYVLTPLPLALGQAGDVAGGEIGALFGALGRRIGLQSRQTPKDALQEILADGSYQGIPHEALSIMRDLVAVLGGSGYREQEKYLDLAVERVRTQSRLLATQWQRHARMYRYLGVLGGLAAVVILL